MTEAALAAQPPPGSSRGNYSPMRSRRAARSLRQPLNGTRTTDRRDGQRVRRIGPPSRGGLGPCSSRSRICCCAICSTLSLVFSSHLKRRQWSLATRWWSSSAGWGGRVSAVGTDCSWPRSEEHAPAPSSRGPRSRVASSTPTRISPSTNPVQRSNRGWRDTGSSASPKRSPATDFRLNPPRPLVRVASKRRESVGGRRHTARNGLHRLR